MIIQSKHGLLPSFAAIISAHPRLDQYQYEKGKGLILDEATLPLDYAGNFYPRHWNIPVYSYKELLRKQGIAHDLKDKIVIVGALIQNDKFTDPVLVNAQAIASARSNHFITFPYWYFAGERLAILFVALYLLLLPAHTLYLRGIVIHCLIAVFAIFVAWAYLRLKWVWSPVWFPTLTMIVGLFVVTFQERFRSLLEELFADAILARSDLALVRIQQGKLDEAFELLMPYPYDRISAETLYQLACSYQNRQLLIKAQQVLLKIVKSEPRYKDSQERLQIIEKELKPLLSANPYANKPLTDTNAFRNSRNKFSTLGRYHVESELGRGAFGIVYMGKDPKIGRKVAIKTLDLSGDVDDTNYNELVDRFFREAEAAGRLDHPNIVTVFDAGEEHELAYIAMDYVEGESLDRYIDPKNLLSTKKVVMLITQAANALSYAHDQNVVHRDIKPANIIYSKDTASIKITDFGIACLTDTSKTATGIIMGSPSYMSPEQVDGKKLDGRSDLFSLGTTLYQLLTGKLPFQGDTVANLMYNIRHSKTPNINKVRSGIPHQLARVINKVLQKNPEKRYKTGATMAEALDRCFNK